MTDRGAKLIAGLSHLKVLDISDNSDITEEGVKHIVEGLHNKLQELRIAGNNLKDSAAGLIASGLVFLTKLCINNNNLTTEGAMAISVAKTHLSWLEIGSHLTNLRQVFSHSRVSYSSESSLWKTKRHPQIMIIK